MRLAVATGVGSIAFILAGCGGAAAPAQVMPSALAPTPVEAKPGGSVAKVDAWALPDGPRDGKRSVASASSIRLDAWERALKAKCVAAAPASCAAEANRVARSPVAEIVRAAEIAPAQCADRIVDPHVRAAATTEFGHVLVGLSLAGKLARTATAPPSMGAARDKDKVKAFVAGPLKAWLVDQSAAIEMLASGAAGLTGYGRGIAAMEAGVAEMRLVDTIRSAPLPASWDPELKAIYEAALDEALEPRKRRGRDAALVGMSDFADQRIVNDERLDRARALLARLYGGRRIDALDALLLPPREVRSPSTPNQARSERMQTSSARDRFEMGRVYWRRVDFVEAAHRAKATPEDRLVLALSLALVHAPNGAAAMMNAPSPAALDLTHTEALDALADEGGPFAGMAAFNAAELRALSPPEGDGGGPYLRDVAARFRSAEARLTDPAQKKRAAERAAELEAVAANVR